MILDAVSAYEQLIGICPDVDEYKLYYAQSLYKAGQYPEAAKAANRIQGRWRDSSIKRLVIIFVFIIFYIHIYIYT